MINSQRQKKQSSSALVILDEVIEPIIFFAEDDGFPYVFSDMKDITTSHFEVEDMKDGFYTGYDVLGRLLKVEVFEVRDSIFGIPLPWNSVILQYKIYFLKNIVG